MKLFLIDDCDYVIANSEEQALKFYIEEVGFVDDKIIDESDIVEIVKEDWDKKSISLDEYDEKGELITMTFNEYLEQFSDDEPRIVGCTEQ